MIILSKICELYKPQPQLCKRRNSLFMYKKARNLIIIDFKKCNKFKKTLLINNPKVFCTFKPKL
jgi:hypothetical protein